MICEKCGTNLKGADEKHYEICMSCRKIIALEKLAKNTEPSYSGWID